jgi:hypothetical protein
MTPSAFSGAYVIIDYFINNFSNTAIIEPSNARRFLAGSTATKTAFAPDPGGPTHHKTGLGRLLDFCATMPPPILNPTFWYTAQIMARLSGVGPINMDERTRDASNQRSSALTVGNFRGPQSSRAD